MPTVVPTLSLALTLSLVLSACGGEEVTYEFEDVRERSKPRHNAPGDVTAAERLGFKPRDAAHGHGGMGQGARQQPTFAWKTPAGWREVKVGSMRTASWVVDKVEGTDCSLTILPTGGDAFSNVNRWRKEMGLAALDRAAFGKLAHHDVLGAKGIYLDFEGDYNGGASGKGAMKSARMLGIIVPAPTSMVFLKFTGPADRVAAEKKHFEELASSIRLEQPAAPAHPPIGTVGGQTRSPTTWSVPEGWQEQPKKMMRVATFVPKDLPNSWCYASVVGGGMVPNLNRWRREMGVAALSEAEVKALPKVPVMGKQAVLLEITGTFRGTGGPPLDGAKMFGLVCPLGGQDLFVKMVGPADKLDTQRAKFIEFCKSLK